MGGQPRSNCSGLAVPRAGVPSGGSALCPLPCDDSPLLQGLYEECQYLFQPQLIVQRLVNIAVLYPGHVTEQSMAPHNRSCLYK